MSALTNVCRARSVKESAMKSKKPGPWRIMLKILIFPVILLLLFSMDCMQQLKTLISAHPGGSLCELDELTICGGGNGGLPPP